MLFIVQTFIFWIRLQSLLAPRAKVRGELNEGMIRHSQDQKGLRMGHGTGTNHSDVSSL